MPQVERGAFPSVARCEIAHDGVSLLTRPYDCRRLVTLGVRKGSTARFTVRCAPVADPSTPVLSKSAAAVPRSLGHPPRLQAETLCGPRTSARGHGTTSGAQAKATRPTSTAPEARRPTRTTKVSARGSIAARSLYARRHSRMWSLGVRSGLTLAHTPFPRISTTGDAIRERPPKWVLPLAGLGVQIREMETQ